ncbi:MAG: hypothetical protein ACRDJO_02755 [Actinomycetota bacterium]
MPGEPDLVNVAARRVLLDALEALENQLDALILVGAQAIYLHTGEAEIAVAVYTTDADLAVDPSALQDQPELEQAMTTAGFVGDMRQPGAWRGRDNIEVDLMVPEAVGGAGRRGARLGVHGTHAARKARGLEAALVDRRTMTIRSLEDHDVRRFDVNVAGPSALLVAKLHKIGERRASPGRLVDKDALDVLRLLRSIATDSMAAGLRELTLDERSREVTTEAVALLEDLFAAPEALGSQLAARAVGPLGDPVEIAMSCAVLAQDLLQEVGRADSAG